MEKRAAARFSFYQPSPRGERRKSSEKYTTPPPFFRIFFVVMQKNEKYSENLLTNAGFWYMILTTRKTREFSEKG